MAQGLREFPLDQEMLFDLVYDPNETNNLVADPNHQVVLNDLRTQLKKWMEETQDPLLADAVVPFPQGAFVNDPDADAPLDSEPISQEAHLKTAY